MNNPLPRKEFYVEKEQPYTSYSDDWKKAGMKIIVKLIISFTPGETISK